MGVFKTVVIFVLSLSFIVFIALFGRLPAFRRTPVGFLHRLLLRHIPKALSKVDGILTGGRIVRSVSATFNYLLHEKHPVVLIFFVGLQIAGEILMLPPIYPTLPQPQQLLTIPIVLLPYYYLYLCATTTSAILTLPSPSHNSQLNSPPSSYHPSHRSALTAYPYDHLLFHPGFFCSTCHHPKPARSKHCSLCRACIQRQDHHCIWINNCVGRNNHLYFLLLLVSVTILLAYGTLLGYNHLTLLLTQRFAPKELLRGSTSARASQVLWRVKFTYKELFNLYIWAFTRAPMVGATTLLTLMCTPLSTGFLVYHVYLLWVGATTNETQKWSEWREDVGDGIVWRARVEDLRKGIRGGGEMEHDREREGAGEGKYEPLPDYVQPKSEDVNWPPNEIPRWLWKSASASKSERKSITTENGTVDRESLDDSISISSYNVRRKDEYRYRPEYWYTTTANGHPPTVTITINHDDTVDRPSRSRQQHHQRQSSTPNAQTPAEARIQAEGNDTRPSTVIQTQGQRGESLQGQAQGQRRREVIPDPRWQRVLNFSKEVENIYDLGFLGNLWEVVFHRE